LREANYALLDPVWKGAAKIPAGYVLQVPVQYTDKMNEVRTPEPIKSRIVTTSSGEGKMYRVTGKDSLRAIAARFNTTPERIAQMNRLTTSEVQVGQVLLVPRNGGGSTNEAPVADVVVAAAQQPVPEAAVAKVSTQPKRGSAAPTVRKHKVRKGETLASIAARYGRSISDVKKANGMRGSTLIAGQVIRIP
jgi:membrane-bound lytic murein transglycosylase D